MTYSRLKCPKCDKIFAQEIRFIDHLADDHDIVDHFALFLELYHNGQHPMCACDPACKSVLKWWGWKKGFPSQFVRGHNARLDSVWFDKKRQREFTAKRTEGYKIGRNKVWNAGLTTETDDRVAQLAKNVSTGLNKLYESGYVSWQTGLTAKTDDRVARQTATRQHLLDTGVIKVWNDGLTKYDHPSLMRVSKQLSEWHQ